MSKSQKQQTNKQIKQETNKEHYERISEETFHSLKKLSKASDWKRFGKQDGIDVDIKPHPTSGYNYFKAHITIKAAPTVVSNTIWGLQDINEVRQFDTSATEFKTIEEINSNMRIDYAFAQMTWPVSHRDMIYLLCRRNDPNNENICYIWALSITEDSKIPKLTPKKRTIRMTVIGFFEFEGVKGFNVDNSPSTNVTRIIYGDPAGSMPLLIVNRSALIQVASILSWMNFKSLSLRSKL